MTPGRQPRGIADRASRAPRGDGSAPPPRKRLKAKTTRRSQTPGKKVASDYSILVEQPQVDIHNKLLMWLLSSISYYVV